MPLTDITNATQNEHITTDNYTCGVIISRFEASQTPAEIYRQMVSLDPPLLIASTISRKHVWAYLEKRIETCRYQIQNVDQLEAALREEWYAIPLSYLEKLVESMSSRCQAVIEAKGGNTHY